MAPLTPAHLAGLTPGGVQVAFYDDSLEPIPFDEPTDLVALTVEAYTAKRAYQIASEYRKRRVPVVMGGIHATLCPEDVARYAESVVIGQAEDLWVAILRDAERGTLQTYYHAPGWPDLSGLVPDRRIFGGKGYLPLTMVERGRGCQFQCEFCSVQSAYNHGYASRPIDDIVTELLALQASLRGSGKGSAPTKGSPLVFFVDDNIAGYLAQAKEFLRALVPLKIRWVGQASLNAAYDEEYLELLRSSGCIGLLIGFESLSRETLKQMNKPVNALRPDFEEALANLRRHGLRIYATFAFGYDDDTPESFASTVEFARAHRFFMAAFNHLVPFPGTPLYRRLEAEGRLLHERWWLAEGYSFNQVSFRPRHMSPEELELGCYGARKAFYSLPSIIRRGVDAVNLGEAPMLLYYPAINLLSRHEVYQRHHFPLGDEGWDGELIRVRDQPTPPPGPGKREA
jgi:radical SAM superfamily enzyme YgiQ (UPF0313 family)